MYYAMGLYALLCFPVFITPFAYYDERLKKAFFSVTIFGFIRINGYARIKNFVIYLHLSEKRAIAIKLVSTKSMFEKGVGVFRSLEFFSASAYLSLPANEECILITGVATFLKNTLLPIYKTNKPFVKATGVTTLGRRENAQIFFKCTFAFNLITVLTLLIRKLKEAI